MTDHAPAHTPFDDRPDASADEMRRREHAWHSTHRAGALWPGLDAEILQRAADAIGVAVAEVLRDGRAKLQWDVGGSDAERRTRALGVAALLTGVGPLLGAWLERGTLAADPPLAGVLARHLAHSRARMARIRAGALPVLARMEAAGLAPGVIKGFHTAHVYFPEPGARPTADVDVVVAPEHVPHAMEILRDAGFASEYAIASGAKSEWLPPDHDGAVHSHELWHVRNPWKLDLHDGLNFAVIMQVVRMRQTPTFGEILRIDDVSLRVCDPNELISVLATHGSTEIYSQRLLRLVELVLVVRRAESHGRLDWGEVEASLDRRGTRRFAYPLLTLVEQLAPRTVPTPVLARLRAETTRRIREVTSHFTPTSPILDERFSLSERLLWASGVRATVRRFWRMISPLEGVPLGARLSTYRHRAARLLSIIAGRWRSDDAR
jgi:Uncharacterised nucleotidyltransferase